MSALSQLTPAQLEAVLATAAQHLLDAEELAAELLPRLLITPEDEVGEPAGPIPWTPLQADDTMPPGVVFRVLPPVPPTVNKSLTPTEPMEAAP